MASDSYPRPANNGGIVTELMYERLVSSYTPDGLIGDPSVQPMVYADGVGVRQVRVRANYRALVRGFFYNSGSSEFPLTLDENTSGTTRVDLIVLRLDRSTWRVQEAIIKGTPGAGQPGWVAQPDTGFWDIPIAAVTVPHNATTLLPSSVKYLAWYLGPDGLPLLCTATTLPPHSKGRRIYRWDTGVEYVSNGQSWVQETDDTGWVNLTPATGWGVNTLRIRRHGGVAYLHVDVDRTGGNLAAGATSTLTTVPAGYRLSTGQVFASATIYHSEVGRIAVNSSGVVTLSNHPGVGTNRYVVSSASWPIG